MKQHFWLVAALVLAVSGCAGKGNLPAIDSTETGNKLVGKFVWRELLTENAETAESFYGDLFGWTFKETEASDYRLILHQGRPIAGMVSVGRETEDVDYATVSAAVRRLERRLKKDRLLVRQLQQIKKLIY